MATFYVSDGYVADGYFQTGVSIDWATKVIFVPQFFLTYLGGTVYQLDTDLFRKSLKDLEDSPEGIVFPITHNHNTSVLLGGIEYARIIEITNGYTITFEETGTPYVVNLVGSNNNILDVTNLGTVQIRSNNSAGLINVREVQFNTFLSGVHVDQVSGSSGTAYPSGTPLQPVNNFSDAITIATVNGFDTIYVFGAISLGEGDNVSGYTIRGQNASKTIVTVASEAVTEGCEIYEATVTGTLDNGIVVRDSILDNVDYINGIAHNCMLKNTIRLGGTAPAYFLNCYSAATSDDDLLMPVIDFNGADDGQNTSMAMHKWSGYLKLIEKTGGSNAILDVASAEIIIDSSCTNGSISCRGTGAVVDSLHVKMPSGTYNGSLVLDNDMIYGEWVHEIWQRLDLDPNVPNTYANDASNITNSRFTLNKTDNGNNTSTVQRS
jgi:hypothetical protein